MCYNHVLRLDHSVWHLWSGDMERQLTEASLGLVKKGNPKIGIGCKELIK